MNKVKRGVTATFTDCDGAIIYATTVGTIGIISKVKYTVTGFFKSEGSEIYGEIEFDKLVSKYITPYNEFDIIIDAINEYGVVARLKLLGVKLDDHKCIELNTVMKFHAREIHPWSELTVGDFKMHRKAIKNEVV